MRQARFLVPEDMVGVYHVVSRVVERRLAFGEDEKRHFVKLLKGYAGFSGLDLLSWCVMGNHFHILVAVPVKSDQELPESEVLRRMSLIYDKREMKEFRVRLEACGAPESRRALLLPYIRRMGDLSLFMKTLKQRFSQWFNRKHERKGTLWEERFRSTIVEHTGYSLPVVGSKSEASEVKSHAARVVAAYIDLNPVRAGLVEDPKDYRWSSYGEAVCGDAIATAGIMALWGEDKAQSLQAHRVLLYEEGSEERVPQEGEKSERKGIDVKKVWEERARGGRLPLGVMLRLRVRYLTDGAVVGSKEFVERVTEGRLGEKKSGMPMRFGKWGKMHSLKNLQKNVVTSH